MIAFKNYQKAYGEKVVFKDFNLELETEKITAVLGASGSGKTTLLNAVAGIPQKDNAVTGVPETVSYIFQNQALLPNLTVAQNIDFVLKHCMVDAAMRAQKIAEMLDAVGLTESAARYPAELSTGMAQRVSMARAYAYPSELILMDEPFRGLDVGIKQSLFHYFRELWQREKRTVLMVTHGIDEALLLADTVLLLGGAPATVQAVFSIQTPKEERNMSDAALSALYAEIYNLFVPSN